MDEQLLPRVKEMTDAWFAERRDPIAPDAYHLEQVALRRALIENTHTHLKYLGYAGTVLVPGEDRLIRMYEKLGYSICSSIGEFSCNAGTEPIQLRKVDSEEYCRLRREYLPPDSVLQEGDYLHFLECISDFYAGDDFLATVYRQDSFFCPELLGNTRSAPGILAALHYNKGSFRCPGDHTPFAMYHPLSELEAPKYFAYAFD